jgi:hypothetical protein
LLVFQDEKNRQVGPKGYPVHADVSAPSGDITLHQVIEIPADGKQVVLFIPIRPDGMSHTRGGAVVRYPLVDN